LTGNLTESAEKNKELKRIKPPTIEIGLNKKYLPQGLFLGNFAALKQTINTDR
jgi:hypothetical protein